MSDASLASFEADGRWFLAHGQRGAFLVPVPLHNEDPADLETVLFLADCISFDHDSPVVVRHAADNPESESSPISPLFPLSPKFDGQMYWSMLHEALGLAVEMRLGSGTVVLRYEMKDPLAQFHTRFSRCEEPLTLYGMATRQVDVIGEYLCLYRILEWARKDNGVSYIEAHLDKLRTHDFGALEAYDAFRRPTAAPLNVFEVHRQRALSRIGALKAGGRSDRDIGERLYGIRNAIAHGKSRFLRGRAEDMYEVGLDIPIVKLLARLVIEGLR